MLVRPTDHTMLKIIKSPTRIQAAGNPPKTIEEFIGPMTSGITALSVARMVSPSGWSESGQTPEFDEFTVVLRGQLRVETRDGVQDVLAGQVHRTTRPSGCVTARLIQRVQSMSQYVHQHFHHRQFTETHTEAA